MNEATLRNMTTEELISNADAFMQKSTDLLTQIAYQRLRKLADSSTETENELQNALRLLGDKETELQNALDANREKARHAHRLDLLINRQPTGKPLGELVDQVETMFAQIREQMAALQLNLAKLREGRNAQRDPGALILPDDRRH